MLRLFKRRPRHVDLPRLDAQILLLWAVAIAGRFVISRTRAYANCVAR